MNRGADNRPGDSSDASGIRLPDAARSPDEDDDEPTLPSLRVPALSIVRPRSRWRIDGRWFVHGAFAIGYGALLAMTVPRAVDAGLIFILAVLHGVYCRVVGP